MYVCMYVCMYIYIYTLTLVDVCSARVSGEQATSSTCRGICT